MSDYQENLPLEEAEETIVNEREEQLEQFDGVIEEAAEISRETYDSLGTEKYEATDKPAGETAVVKTGNTAAAIYKNETPTDRLMRIALEKDNIDALEKLIALKNQEEDRNARKLFDEHFSLMQKDLVPVLKNRDGSKTTDGKVAFRYAPLEEIERLNKSIITNHGFSYRWREEERENGEKRIRLIISGWGWTDKETYFDVPKIDSNKLTTSVQTRGMQSSYGRRYTFISGFGITVEGEDDESKLGFEDSLIYAEYIARVTACKNIEQLKFEMEDIWKKLGTDDKGKQALNEHYKKKRAELQQGGQQ